MGLKCFADPAREAFHRWGWLLPAFLPLAQVGGRGAFNTLSAVYALWALVGVRRSDFAGDLLRHRRFFALYALMLLCWTLSLTQAADVLKGGGDLLRFVQFSATGLFTLVALQQDPAQLGRLMRALAAGALLVIVVLTLQLPYYLFAVPFAPTQQLREDNLPWLLPFLLLALADAKHARWLAAAAIAAFTAYIGLSQGRAALLALLAGLATFALLGFRVRKRVLVVAGVAILAAGMLLGDGFFRGISGPPLDFPTLARFTSERSTIWWQALNAPPANPWLGVGLGNVVSYPEVLRIGDETVKHLHNFLLDAWFETGLLGLAALVALIGSVIAHGLRIRRQLDAVHRRIAAATLGAIAALLTAGLLSFSYTSRQFSVYLFLLFAILLALPGDSRRPTQA